MRREVKDILIVIKKKLKSTTAIIVYILIFIITGCVIFIKIFSVQVLNAAEVREELVGRTVIINNNTFKLTEENLLEVDIISRKTKKDLSDNIDLKIDVIDDDVISSIKGNVVFTYKDGIWTYDDLQFENIFNVEEEGELSRYIINYFMKCGMTTCDNEQISQAIINKINNLKLDNDSIYKGKRFTLSMVLYNGACFQNCDVEGEVYYNSEELKFRDIKIISKGKVYKEKNPDIKVIEKVVSTEILSGGIFKLENSNKYKEEYIKFDSNSIDGLSIKDYIVKDDNSIRAEVEGKIHLQEYEDNFDFDGIVSITGKLSSGSIRNSKSINIYNVPFNKYREEDEENK